MALPGSYPRWDGSTLHLQINMHFHICQDRRRTRTDDCTLLLNVSAQKKKKKKCFSSRVTHVRSTHVSLAKASHVPMPNFKVTGKGSSSDYSCSHWYCVHFFTWSNSAECFHIRDFKMIQPYTGSFGFYYLHAFSAFCNNFSEIVMSVFSKNWYRILA